MKCFEYLKRNGKALTKGEKDGQGRAEKKVR